MSKRSNRIHVNRAVRDHDDRETHLCKAARVARLPRPRDRDFAVRKTLLPLERQPRGALCGRNSPSESTRLGVQNDARSSLFVLGSKRDCGVARVRALAQTVQCCRSGRHRNTQAVESLDGLSRKKLMCREPKSGSASFSYQARHSARVRESAILGPLPLSSIESGPSWRRVSFRPLSMDKGDWLRSWVDPTGRMSCPDQAHEQMQSSLST
jgi:hypothetical protein